MPDSLRYADTPVAVEFRGWLSVAASETSVRVQAETLDGRVVTQTVAVPPGGELATGRLHIVVARPTDRVSDTWTRVAELAGEADRTLLLGDDATVERLTAALVQLQGVGPDDVVLVHVAGTLTADSTAAGPSIALAGGEISTAYLARLLRATAPAATLLSFDVAPGFSWQTARMALPGLAPPPGCLEIADFAPGRTVDLGPLPGSRLLEGLTGDADRDADGRILVDELLQFLGTPRPLGLSAARPHGVVLDLRGAR